MANLLGPYQILGRIGEGGLSRVFLALRPNGKPCALKVLKNNRAQMPEAVTGFIREAFIGSRLSHPSLLKVHDSGKIRNSFFLVTDLLLGLTLGQVLRHFESREEEAPLALRLYCINQLCEVMAYLHKQSIMDHARTRLFHGDISIDNLFLGHDGVATLIDYGSMSHETRFSPTQKIFGKFNYLPYEVLRGQSPTRKTDVYSLAVLAFRCMSGKFPFEAKDRRTLRQKISQGELPSVDWEPLVNSNAQAHKLQVLFQKALNKDEELRFQNIQEFNAAWSKINFSERAPRHPTEVQSLFLEHFSKHLLSMHHRWRSLLPKARPSKTPRATWDHLSLQNLMDRRQFPRLDVSEKQINAQVIDPSANAGVDMCLEEIGPRGSLLKWTALELEMGKKLIVQISFPNIDSAHQIEAITRYELSRDGQSFVGIEFLNAAPSFQKDLDDWTAQSTSGDDADRLRAQVGSSASDLTYDEPPTSPFMLNLYPGREAFIDMLRHVAEGFLTVDRPKVSTHPNLRWIRVTIPGTWFRFVLPYQPLEQAALPGKQVVTIDAREAQRILFLADVVKSMGEAPNAVVEAEVDQLMSHTFSKTVSEMIQLPHPALP